MDFLLNNPKLRCRDIAKVERKIKKLVEDGIKKLMVISDFDYTLSKYHDSKGQKCWTTHGVFETASSAVCSELNKQCAVLKAKYLPIEYDPYISIEEKTPMMEDWWRTAHNYIIDAKLTSDVLEHCVRNSKIELRDDADLLFANLHSYGIPLIIFSAGIGNVIQMFLKQKFGRIMENMHVISNMMEFDEEGYVANFLEPLIHTFCKNASVLGEGRTFYDAVSGRTNVVLMGDSLGDLDMDLGVENEGVVLKIGFLNFNYDLLIEKYLDGYDIVLVDDQSMDVPCHIFKSICFPVEFYAETSNNRKLSSTCRVEAAEEEHQTLVKEEEEPAFVSADVTA